MNCRRVATGRRNLAAQRGLLLPITFHVAPEEIVDDTTGRWWWDVCVRGWCVCSRVVCFTQCSLYIGNKQEIYKECCLMLSLIFSVVWTCNWNNELGINNRIHVVIFVPCQEWFVCVVYDYITNKHEQTRFHDEQTILRLILACVIYPVHQSVHSIGWSANQLIQQLRCLQRTLNWSHWWKHVSLV